MKRNLTLALNLAAIAAGMAGLAFASVPLYRLFCQTTGFAGTPQRSAARSHHVVNRTITVSFNADVAPGLAWDFEPESRSIPMRVGENILTHFLAHNRTNAPLKGHAVYNVLPETAGAYFVKIECFCFKEQTLAAYQTAYMPVLFYIDPAIMEDPNMDGVTSITLSYTFFPSISNPVP